MILIIFYTRELKPGEKLPPLGGFVQELGWEITLNRENQMDTNIPGVGQDAPDFEVLTSTGRIFKLSEELKSGSNVKLMFYRGHW